MNSLRSRYSFSAALCVAAFGLLVLVSPAAAQIADSTYRRAETFLPWNVPELYANASVTPHWIDDANRFWYRRETSGGHEFVLVDPAEQTVRPAFDHERLARSLSEATGETYSADELPLTTFTGDPGAGTIRFDVEGEGWACTVAEGSCTRLARPIEVRGEARSPDGSWSVFVRDNDLFARSEATGDTFRLTREGGPHNAYATPPEGNFNTVRLRQRGLPPNPAVSWGPNSRRLLTMRLNERDVGKMHLLDMVPSADRYRPRLFTYRYPLPGDSVLPTATLSVVDVKGKNVTSLRSNPLVLRGPSSPVGSDAWWGNEGKKIYFLDYSRGWKSVRLRAADPGSGNVRTLVTEERNERIDLNPIVTSGPIVRVLRGGHEVIWFSERDGWGQLYLYDGRTGDVKNRITDGSFVVRSIEHVDTEQRQVYFTATGVQEDADPYFRHLYRTSLDGGALTSLTPERADHSIEFSPDGQYFVDNYFWGDQRSHPVTVLRNADGAVLRILERGSLEGLRETGAGLPERFSVKAADGKTNLYGLLYRPSNFDPDRSYPVLDWVYPYPQLFWSSPGLGTPVSQLQRFLRPQPLAELGFVVVTLDGRGTAGRSREFHDFSYGRLLEGRLRDQVAALRQLAGRYPFMDLDRVGVFGHSGGGAGTVRAMLSHPELFKVGVAASGPEDPRGYHAVWEAFQGYPLDEERWDAQANWRLAHRLDGKLLLIHGGMDENVHPSHTMRLIDALIEANRDFDLLMMPGRGHSLSSEPYFHRQRWDYFVQNLLGEEPPKEYRIESPPGQRP